MNILLGIQESKPVGIKRSANCSYYIFYKVFEAVISWIKKDTEERSKALPELMVKVRLPLLTPQYLSDRVATEELIKNSLKCRFGG